MANHAKCLTYKLRDVHDKPLCSNTKGTIGGHARLKLYGRLNCPSALRHLANGHYRKNRVFFADEPTAIKAGYRPCAVCMPEQYKLWKGTTEEHPNAVCVYIENKGLVLGATRRHSLIWGLPGGKVDHGEAPLDAIIRETFEETGLRLAAEELELVFERVCGPGKDGRSFLAFGYKFTGDVTRLKPESCELGILVDWCTRTDLLNGAFGEYNTALFEVIDSAA